MSSSRALARLVQALERRRQSVEPCSSLSACEQVALRDGALLPAVAQVLDGDRLRWPARPRPGSAASAHRPASAALSCLPSLRSPNASSALMPAGAQRLGQPERLPLAALVHGTRNTRAARLDAGTARPAAVFSSMMIRSMPLAKPTPGVGRAAQLLGQTVVATAAAERALRADHGRPDLPDRARVVVQSAHQARVDRVRDARRLQMVEPALEVHAALVAQVIGAVRRALEHGLALGPLFVQQAQRIGLESPLAVLAQARPGARGSTRSVRAMYAGRQFASPMLLTCRLKLRRPSAAYSRQLQPDQLGVDQRVGFRRSPRSRSGGTRGSGPSAAGRSGTRSAA